MIEFRVHRVRTNSGTVRYHPLRAEAPHPDEETQSNRFGLNIKQDYELYMTTQVRGGKHVMTFIHPFIPQHSLVN
jgi:hypothetical protein